MAKVIGYGEIKGEVTLVLSEVEAKALDALVGYGVDSFLRVFYEHLGKGYLQPYERGLKSLFESVRTGEGSVSNFLQRVHDARDVFSGKKAPYVPPEYREHPEVTVGANAQKEKHETESGPTHADFFTPKLQLKVKIRGYKKLILERDFERGANATKENR